MKRLWLGLLACAGCQLFINAGPEDLIENNATLCHDQTDNDGDNNTDCADTECAVFCAAVCGDGVLVAPEQCDDGNTTDGDTCEADCSSPRCQNGILDAGETCDDGNKNNNDACPNDCELLSVCGDSVVTPGELCPGVASSVAAGVSPRDVVIADLNNDQHADVIVASTGADKVEILFGDGSGGLSAGVEVTIGVEPRLLAVGDLDGDGALDIAAALFEDNAIGVLFGDGVGGFAPVLTLPVGQNPDALVFSDLNLDGRLDIAVTCQGDNTIGVLLSSGVRSFSAPLNQTFEGGPNAIAAGDFTGDSVPDLLVGNAKPPGKLGFFEGDGAGGFSLFDSENGNPDLQSVQLVDLNQDQFLDVITATGQTSKLRIRLGQVGGFGNEQNVNIASSPLGQHSVAVSDLNQDGIVDMAITASDDNKVSIFLGEGDGTFQDPTLLSAGARPFSVSIGDLNEDGAPDLVTTDEAADQLSIFLAKP